VTQTEPAIISSRGGRGRETSAAGAPDRGQSVREAAEYGTVGSSGLLPYVTEIQRAFGRHEVNHIRAHQGSRAAAAARAIGARAYTTGEKVAFAGSPDLHTAAHEAAHVVQQRAGVQLTGNVGEVGDVYERHADAVADRVVAGQSSEALLDAYAPGASPQSIKGTGTVPHMNQESGGTAARSNVVQMKALDTAYGKFEDVYYDKLTNAKDEEIGCEMYLRFTPGDMVDATKIGLAQVIKPTKEGKLDPADEGKKKQAVASGTGKDFYVDQYSGTRNPLYVTSDAPASDVNKMGAWKEGPKVTPMSKEDQKKHAEGGIKGLKYDGLGQHGYRKKLGEKWVVQPAELDDWPTRPGSIGKKNSGQYFETTALAVEGAQANSYYGSVQWGWERDAKAAFKLVEFKIVSRGAPSASFMAAAEKWNTSKTTGGDATIKLPTVELYTTSKEMEVLAGAKKIKLPAKTRVQVISKGAAAKDPWQVKIVDGPDTGQQVSVDGATLIKE
jgi:hypothetical protein